MKIKDSAERLPPGQQLVAPGKWPIIGEREPAESEQPWSLEIVGELEQPLRFSVDELRKMPQTRQVIDIHCVTRWSMLQVPVSGVLLATLLDEAKLNSNANFVSFVARSSRLHSSSLSVSDACEQQTLVALEMNGEEISREHGGPIRNIVPGRYFYKSVKWLTKIELLEQDVLGYWEAETGYHNHADPWKEERYMVPNLDRRTVIRLLESKDFSGHDLRSIDASDRNLDGLNAKNALLRDAKFQRSSLVGADFTSANLSNAHLNGSNLSNAKLVGTDLEGANLASANLCGADLTGCSLIGASFCNIATDGTIEAGAFLDAKTIIPWESLEPLTPTQIRYVQSQLDVATEQG